ncbi:MAG: PD-(D/E)XK nuclease family protein [Firmicutes bacterium]|nr:PD-(D/E)XK nuclease family protein [Bacillota bacterium]
MIKLNTDDFIKNFLNSNSKKKLFIAPSKESKNLYATTLLKSKQLEADIIAFSELYFSYIRENNISLPDDALKKSVYRMALIDMDIYSDDSFSQIISRIDSSIANNKCLDELDHKIHLNYRKILNQYGLMDRDMVLNDILGSDYIRKYQDYDEIYFMPPKYASFFEAELGNRILNLATNVYIIYNDEKESGHEFKLMRSDSLEFLCSNIALEIKNLYRENPNITIALTNESRANQKKIAKILLEHGIHTNISIKEPISDILFINNLLDSLGEDPLEDLKIDEFDNIKISDETKNSYELAYEKIIEANEKYNFNNFILSRYIKDVFSTTNQVKRQYSNIHVLNPNEVLLNYDIIYQIGISEIDFNSESEFDEVDSAGLISNILNRTSELIFSSYDPRALTKRDLLKYNLVPENVDNFSWLKGQRASSILEARYCQYNKTDERADIDTINNIEKINRDVRISLRPNTLSFSRINCYQECPYRYFIMYFLGIKEPVDENSNYMLIGSYCHELLAYYYQFNGNKGYDEYRLKNAIDRTNNEKYDKLFDYQKKICIELVRYFLQFDENLPGIVDTVEHSFSSKYFKDEFGRDILINGIYDRIDIVDDKYILYDYKLGGNVPNKSDIIGGNALQFPIYISAFAKEVAAISYINLKESSLKWPMIDKSEDVKLNSLKSDGFEEVNFDQILNDASINIKNIVSDMDKFIINPNYKSKNCARCKYQDICRRRIYG